jgi:hypothetical protein
VADLSLASAIVSLTILIRRSENPFVLALLLIALPTFLSFAIRLRMLLMP